MNRHQVVLAITLLVVGAAAARAQTRTDWSAWTALGCLNGIEWRSRVTSYNEYARKYEWLVQFRNSSPHSVHFSFVLRPRGDHEKPNHRATVRTGKTYDMWFLLPAKPGPRAVEVVWDRVRVGPADEWGAPYWDACGKAPQSRR